MRMKLVKLKHVERQKTRFGKELFYYRPAKGRRVRINATPDDPSFEVEYERAATAWQSWQRHVRVELATEEKMAVKRVLTARVKNALSRDKMRGRKSDITPEWAWQQMEQQNFLCAVTGISFLVRAKSRRANPYSPSLDRIDNDKGYERGNVQLVLFAVNLMRLDWGNEVFDHIARAYVQREQSQTIWEPPQTLKKFAAKSNG